MTKAELDFILNPYHSPPSSPSPSARGDEHTPLRPSASERELASASHLSPVVRDRSAPWRVSLDAQRAQHTTMLQENTTASTTDEENEIFDQSGGFWDRVVALKVLKPAPMASPDSGAALCPVQVPSGLSTTEESNSVLPEATTTETVVEASGRKKKITICKELGCRSQALSKHLCMRHGGGPRCTIPGCNNGAKLRNLCFQHGGSTICLAPSCSSKAKRFGYCWSHGGGRICSEEGCNKVAAQGGSCWAHGGGNRCRLPGCTKRSYKQHDYYCKRHAESIADY